jgi:hypothetical protein
MLIAVLTNFRRLIVAVLVLALPLQGFAVSARDCCEQSLGTVGERMSMHRDSAGADLSPCAAHAKSAKADAGHHGGTHKCSQCATCGGLAASGNLPAALFPPMAAAVIPFLDSFRLGDFSAGPDKPPRFLA